MLGKRAAVSSLCNSRFLYNLVLHKPYTCPARRRDVSLVSVPHSLLRQVSSLSFERLSARLILSSELISILEKTASRFCATPGYQDSCVT